MSLEILIYLAGTLGAIKVISGMLALFLFCCFLFVGLVYLADEDGPAARSVYKRTLKKMLLWAAVSCLAFAFTPSSDTIYKIIEAKQGVQKNDKS